MTSRCCLALLASLLTVPVLAQDPTPPLDDPILLADAPTPVAAADATTAQVDVLVVYTPAARSYAGSASAMRSAIIAYVATANRCYVNSNVALRLKLVGTSEVAYTESSTSMSNDIGWVQSDATVATLRNTYGADLVCLVRRGAAGGAAGVGYLGSGQSSFAPYGFSVVADDWADANLTFPHEVGHNFGCNHDRGNAGNPTTGYNYGWRFNGNDNVQYRTVMSYAPGTRIPYFSNPSINYQGVATGVPNGSSSSADNALLLETNSDVTAGFRATATLAGAGVRGDFDGDGGIDLVLQNNTTGARAFWIMSGVYRSSVVALPTGNPAWQIAATGDFNGDGKTDLVFQNPSTGERAIWLMNGTARSSVVTLPTGNPLWRIAAAGDFNGDGKTDLVYQNTSTGERCIWLMNGTSRLSVVTLPIGSTYWQIAAAADFNRDGSTDLVYRNVNTGERCIWLMSGVNRLSVVALPVGTTAWQIAGAGDINYDGNPDLVFENTTTGDRSVWLMSGTTRSSIVTLPNADSAWRIGNR